MNAKVLVGVGLAFVVGVFVWSTKQGQIEEQNNQKIEEKEQEQNQKNKLLCNKEFDALQDKLNDSSRTMFTKQIVAGEADSLILGANRLSEKCPDLHSDLAAFKKSVLENKDR
jgi:hypothetical protein